MYPQHYEPVLDLYETEIAIKKCKDLFESELAAALKLTRVSAPLFVSPETGLNDNLNGYERPVSFSVADLGDANCEIVHSLAKWKRQALFRYGFDPGTGIYTDMNAVRRDEEMDNLHSIYVDQWDWEVILKEGERTRETLHETVRKIYRVFLAVQWALKARWPQLKEKLPEKITFVTSQQLLDWWPSLSPSQREDEAVRRWGAVFVEGIGGVLSDGKAHDGRAPDYDDWNLNGDILFYYPLLDMAFEVSSMGIRVNSETLKAQCIARGCENRLSLPFHQDVISGKLPQTMGGGIGQSRICMYLLDKAHIGEVQASIWPPDQVAECEKKHIHLL